MHVHPVHPPWVRPCIHPYTQMYIHPIHIHTPHTHMYIHPHKHTYVPTHMCTYCTPQTHTYMPTHICTNTPHTYTQINYPPKDKKARIRAFFLSRSALLLFFALFFLRALAFFFTFALASAKAQKREKSAGTQLC